MRNFRQMLEFQWAKGNFDRASRSHQQVPTCLAEAYSVGE